MTCAYRAAAAGAAAISRHCSKSERNLREPPGQEEPRPGRYIYIYILKRREKRESEGVRERCWGGGGGGFDCLVNAVTQMASAARNAEVAAVLKSELEAADDLLRMFANGHEDEKVREHINTHLRKVRGEEAALGTSGRSDADTDETSEAVEGASGFGSAGAGNNGGGLESLWECVSVLLGARCEHMRIMSATMDEVARKEKEYVV